MIIRLYLIADISLNYKLMGFVRKESYPPKMRLGLFFVTELQDNGVLERLIIKYVQKRTNSDRIS